MAKLPDEGHKRAFGGLLCLAGPLVPLKSAIMGQGAMSASTTMLEQSLLGAAVGAAGGVASAVFGVGGGVLVTPALGLMMSPHQAVATSLAGMLLPSALAVRAHSAAGNVCWDLAPALSLGAALGAIGGTHLGLGLSGETLNWVLGAGLFVTGARSLTQGWWRKKSVKG